MSDIISRLSNSEDNTSNIDFNKPFSFEQESIINNSHSESILVPEEYSFLQDKNDINNKTLPDNNNFSKNRININNEDKTFNNKNYISNNNFYANNDFQKNSINFIPNEPFLPKNTISPFIFPILQNPQINTINAAPTNEIKINSNNLPLFNPIAQYNNINPILLNNLGYSNNVFIPTFLKKNSNNIINIKYENKINKKNNKKNITKKNEETKKFQKTENIIKIELLESGEEKRTSVRLFPIPQKYSPFDIIRLIDKYLKTIPGKRIYRSVYVPLVKTIGKNIGYCFVDLVSPKYVIEFYKVFNGLLLKKCKKPCIVIFSDKQNSDNINDNPLREPIFFKDTIKDE